MDYVSSCLLAATLAKVGRAEARNEVKCCESHRAARYWTVDAFYDEPPSGETRARDYVFEGGCTTLGIDSSSAPTTK